MKIQNSTTGNYLTSAHFILFIQITSKHLMWTVSVVSDPLVSRSTGSGSASTASYVADSAISFKHFFQDEATFAIFREGERTARTSLADFVARQFVQQREKATCEMDGITVSLEPLDRIFMKAKRRKQNLSAPYHPYVLERSDFWCSENELRISVRMAVQSTTTNDAMHLDDEKKTEESVLEAASKSILKKIIHVGEPEYTEKLMEHVACTVLQHRIRLYLLSSKTVAFIADGSILPRKSGTSDAPMSSPPAIPFKAPAESSMSQTITVQMDSLAKFLPQSLVANGSTSVTLSGLVVPAGITLICGGGYHGKSTMLRTIALGIYNKIPGDGREFCVSVLDAVSVVRIIETLFYEATTLALMNISPHLTSLRERRMADTSTIAILVPSYQTCLLYQA
jgi:hypothetical protein